MSQELFGKLITSAFEGGVVIDAPQAGRWIKKANDADIDLMVKGDVEALILGRHSRTLTVTHDDVRYYLMAGFRQTNTIVEGFEVTPLTPALLILSVIELDLMPIGTPAEIRNALEGRHKEIDDYDGHDLDDVSPLFPELLCLKASNDFVFTNDPIRAVGSYLSHTYDHGALSISSDTRKSLARLFETGNKYVPYSLVLQGMLSFSWQSFYLEVYRCLENMYPLTRVKKLASSLPLSVPYRDLAILLEKELTWRPREEEALAAVLGQCSTPIIEALNAAMGSTSTSDPQSASARLVYSTRNELVHFRPYFSNKTYKADDIWDAQLRALIDCLDEIYHAAGDMFHELQIKPDEEVQQA